MASTTRRAARSLSAISRDIQSTRRRTKILPMPEKVDPEWWEWEVHTIAALFSSEFEKQDESMRALALGADMAPQTLTNFIRFKTRDPHFSTVVKLAKVFGYKIKLV